MKNRKLITRLAADVRECVVMANHHADSGMGRDKYAFLCGALQSTIKQLAADLSGSAEAGELIARAFYDAVTEEELKEERTRAAERDKRIAAWRAQREGVAA